MVATQLKISSSKNTDKITASKVMYKDGVKHSGSPDAYSANDEVAALKAKNKVLTDALAAVHETAAKELKKKYDLVWFARYRYRYPNHEASKRIEEDGEHQKEIQKLRSDDGDFYHGFNSGVLAAARLFEEQSDVVHINDLKLSPEMMAEAAKHSEKIKESTSKFPHFEVGNDFPGQECD